MTFAPETRARFTHSSHRIERGRCVDCGAASSWPIAEDACPLRNWDRPDWITERVKARIDEAMRLLDAGKSIGEVARTMRLDRKTVNRYARLRAQENEQ